MLIGWDLIVPEFQYTLEMNVTWVPVLTTGAVPCQLNVRVCPGCMYELLVVQIIAPALTVTDQPLGGVGWELGGLNVGACTVTLYIPSPEGDQLVFVTCKLNVVDEPLPQTVGVCENNAMLSEVNVAANGRFWE